MGGSGLKSSSKEVNQEVVDILSYVDTYMYYYKHGTYADGATIAAANSAKKTLASNCGCTVHTLDVCPHVNTVSGKPTRIRLSCTWQPSSWNGARQDIL